MSKLEVISFNEQIFHAVSLSGGKDSTAMLLLMIERGLPINTVLWADTGMEFPEMYDHIRKVDDYLYRERGIHITMLRHPKGFEYLMFEEEKQKPSSIENRQRLGVPLYGNGWPGVKVRWCTGQLKTHLISKEVNRLKGEYQALHYTKMRNVGGIAQTEAQKSSDLFMKCRYLDEITGGRGIVFATGTPISNSMVELYTIQRYLQMSALEEQGLQHFDSWAANYGETVTAIELSPEGTGYRAKTRFAKFYNLPELMSVFKNVADIQTADMLKLPVPEAHYHNIALKPSEYQKEIVASLAERAEKVRNREVDSSVDNMLMITNDGRKLALDQRLINPMLPSAPNSKAAKCAENVFEIWQRTADKRSTQMIFCDSVAIRCYK